MLFLEVDARLVDKLLLEQHGTTSNKAHFGNFEQERKTGAALGARLLGARADLSLTVRRLSYQYSVLVGVW